MDASSTRKNPWRTDEDRKLMEEFAAARAAAMARRGSYCRRSGTISETDRATRPRPTSSQAYSQASVVWTRSARIASRFTSVPRWARSPVRRRTEGAENDVPSIASRAMRLPSLNAMNARCRQPPNSTKSGLMSSGLPGPTEL